MRQTKIAMRSYRNSNNDNGLGCGLALAWLVIAIPLFVLLLLGGGGCEGARKPCNPTLWREITFVAAVIVLAAATIWSTKQLRSGEKNAWWWAAAVLAIVLLAVALVLGWKTAVLLI